MIVRFRDASTDPRAARDILLVVSGPGTLAALEQKLLEKLKRDNLEGLKFYVFDAKTNEVGQEISMEDTLTSLPFPAEPHVLIIKEGETYEGPDTSKSPRHPISPRTQQAVENNTVTSTEATPMSSAAERLAALKAKMKLGFGSNSVSPPSSSAVSKQPSEEENTGERVEVKPDNKEHKIEAVKTVEEKPPTVPVHSPPPPPPPMMKSPSPVPVKPKEELKPSPVEEEKKKKKEKPSPEVKQESPIIESVKRTIITHPSPTVTSQHSETSRVDPSKFIDVPENDSEDPVLLYGNCVLTEFVQEPKKPNLPLSCNSSDENENESGNSMSNVTKEKSLKETGQEFKKGLYEVNQRVNKISYDDYQNDIKNGKINDKMNRYVNDINKKERKHNQKLYFYIHYNRNKLLVSKDTMTIPFVDVTDKGEYPFTGINIPQPSIVQLYPFTKICGDLELVIAVECVGAELLIRDNSNFKLRKYKKALENTETLIKEKFNLQDDKDLSIKSVITEAIRYDKYRRIVETDVLGKVKNIDENPSLSLKDYKKYVEWMKLNSNNNNNNTNEKSPTFEHPKRLERANLISNGVFMSMFIIRNSIVYSEGKNDTDIENSKTSSNNESNFENKKKGNNNPIKEKEKEDKISPLIKPRNIQILVDARCPFLIPSIKLWDELTVDNYHTIENYFNLITERQRYKSAVIETALNKLNAKMHIKNNTLQIYPDVISRSQTLKSHQMFICYDYEDLKSESFNNYIKGYKWVDLAEFEEALLRTYVPTRYIQVIPTHVNDDEEDKCDNSMNSLHTLLSRASLLPFIYPTRILYWILCNYPPPYYSLATSGKFSESILSDISPNSLVGLEKMINTVQMQGNDVSMKILYYLCKNLSGQLSTSLLEELNEEMKKYRAPMEENLKKQGVKIVDSNNILLKNSENERIPEKMTSRTKILQSLIWIVCGINYTPGELTSDGIMGKKSDKTSDVHSLSMFIEKCEKAMLPLSLDLFSCFQKRNADVDLAYKGTLPSPNMNYDDVVNETKSELDIEDINNNNNNEQNKNITVKENLFDNIEMFARSIVNECIYNAYDESKKVKTTIDVKETLDRIVDIVEATQCLVDVTTFINTKRRVNRLLQKEEEEINKNKEKLISESTPKTIQMALDALSDSDAMIQDSISAKSNDHSVTVSPIFIGSQIENSPASVELSPGRLPLLCDVPTPFTLPIRNLSYLFGDIVCSIDSILESVDEVQLLEEEVEKYRSISRIVHMKGKVAEARQMAINMARERKQRESHSLSEKVASVISTSEMPIITISLDKVLEDADEIDEAEALRKAHNENINASRNLSKFNKSTKISLLSESKVRKMKKLMNQDRIMKE